MSIEGDAWGSVRSSYGIISMLTVATLSSLLLHLLRLLEVLDSIGHGNGSPCPVCGENGETYWCGCPDAASHAGVRGIKNGTCEVSNGGHSLVSGQAFFLIHIVWLIILGFSILCGFFRVQCPSF